MIRPHAPESRIRVGEIKISISSAASTDAHVPDALAVKSPDPAQDAIGILFRRNVAGRERVGQKQIGRHEVGLDGEKDVSGTAHLQREEIVGFHQTAIGHLHGRMVVAQFAEQHVERDGFGALSGQFFDQPAIDLTRPVEAKAVAESCRF